MTGNRGWLSGYTKLETKLPIRVGNKDLLFAIGKGTVRVTSNIDGELLDIDIKDTYYVPGISDNLFSQGAADSRGVVCVTGNGQVNLIAKDKTIMRGYKGDGNMFILDIRVPRRANIARTERTLEEWHQALGHPNVREIQHMEKNELAEGLKIVSEPTQSTICGGCPPGKGHRSSHPTSRRERSKELLHRVHMDLVGPVNPPSLGGSRYFLLARDEFSTYMHVYFMSSKAQTGYLLKGYINQAAIEAQRKIQIIRSDNGSEFKNTAIKLMLHSEGIIQEFSAAYTAQQNGESERANRTVLDSARTMLQNSKLPLALWREAILTAVYLRNRITNRRCSDRTPFEVFFGKAPIYDHLVPFGTELQALDNSTSLSKFSAKTIDVFMVGYTNRQNTYRCFDPLLRTGLT